MVIMLCFVYEIAVLRLMLMLVFVCTDKVMNSTVLP